MVRKWLSGALLCALVALSWAETDEHAVPVPSIYGAAGNVRTLSAKTLGSGAMSVAVSFEGSTSSDVFGAGGVSLKNRANGQDTVLGSAAVNDFWAASYRFVFGFGVTDWLDLGFSLPFHQDYVSFKNVPESHRAELERGKASAMGDLELWGKFQYPPYEHSHVFDAAIYGMASVPTGYTDKGMVPKSVLHLPKEDGEAPQNFTADQATLRGMILLTLDLLEIPGTFIPLEFNANFGMHSTVRSNLDNALVLNGSAVLKPIPWFHLFGEVSTTTLMGGLSEKISLRQTQAVASPGVTVHSPVGVFFTAAYDVSLAKDEGRDVEIAEGADDDYVSYSYTRDYNGFSMVLGWSGYVVNPDEDGDGIPNAKDKCPISPEDFDDFEDDDGCPDNDNDEDGVSDSRDECPDVPGPVSNKGCPQKDSDGDGVPDDEDDCPSVFGSRAKDGCPDTVVVRVVDTLTRVDTLTQVDTLTRTDTLTQVDTLTVDNTPAANAGCPFVPVNFVNNYAGPVDSTGCPLPDRDKDGVCDSWVAEMGLLDRYAGICKGNDACLSEPEDADGFEDADGCPDPDNDADGFCDPWVSEGGLLGKYASVCHGVDKCPSQPETMNGFEDNDGCPDKVPKKPINLKGVEFHAGKAVLTDGAMDALMPTVESLRENPDAVVEIGGHTDNNGKRAYNMKLSEERAQSVADFLRQQGVQCEIQVKGYGPDHPIASNKTKAGQRANRRIEMKILGTNAAKPGEAPASGSDGGWN